MSVALIVNGVSRRIDADASEPLLYVLRDRLGLNGAKFGCGLGQCGACTVLVGDTPVFSCLLPVGALEGREVTTVEGLQRDGKPGALQAAFAAEQAAQCGYCIAGMIVRAEALLRKTPDADEADIRAALAPNLCRCGTHMRILRAVKRAAKERA